MVRRKTDETHIATYDVPKRIMLKYCNQAIIPDELVRNDLRTQRYVLATGETVTLDYRATTNNTDGHYDAELDARSMRIHGVPFSVLQSAWYNRLGKLSGWWHTVKIIKGDYV